MAKGDGRRKINKKKSGTTRKKIPSTLTRFFRNRVATTEKNTQTNKSHFASFSSLVAKIQKIERKLQNNLERPRIIRAFYSGKDTGIGKRENKEKECYIAKKKDFFFIQNEETENFVLFRRDRSTLINKENWRLNFSAHQPI